MRERLCRLSARASTRKRGASQRLVSTAQPPIAMAPTATQPTCANCAVGSVEPARAAAIWKMSVRIIAKLCGRPRLPQALQNRAAKVTPSTTAAVAQAWPCARCTSAVTSVTPNTANSMVSALPRGGLTTSATEAAP